MTPSAALPTMPPMTCPGPGSLPDRLPHGDIRGFFAVLESALKIERHACLLQWLQGEVQVFLPHRILITAWGDFAQGPICYDVVSPLPAARTTQLGEAPTHALLQALFRCWLLNRREPCAMPVEAELLGLPPDRAVLGPWSALAAADTLLVHGIKDQRGRRDCLYVLFGTDAVAAAPAAQALTLLLPHLDAAQRQLLHLPEQYPANARSADAEPSDTSDSRLSPRELEIMEWVGKGKTNPEIGMILNTSPFTVKKHLQRVFKKLDVISRAQAVALIMSTN